MAPWYKFALYYLWIAPHVLLAIVPLLMFVRRLHRTFPVFFIYTVYENLVFILLFFAYLDSHPKSLLYRYLFIATLAGSTLLRFGIIQEIVNNIFGDYPRLETIASNSMRWLTVFLLIAAVVSVIYSNGTVADNVLVGLRVLGRSVAIIQAGMLLFLFLFSRMFGLSWHSFTFGIALGFAIFASTELAKWSMELTNLSDHAKDLLDLLPTGSYHASVLVWLGYLLLSERSVASAVAVPEIERWSGELERSR